jgi:hypothetical protein
MAAPMDVVVRVVAGLIGAGAVLLTLDWLATTEYQRGVLAGRVQAVQESAKRPHNCVAWWFQGDPVHADRNLKAACAARESR